MTRQDKERKYWNAKRAYANALKGFKGVGFMRTATAKGLLPRIKRWSQRLAS